MVEMFAALAEPNRYRIVELLRAGPRPVNAIGERLQLTQPQVSKHLRVLKQAGLVDVQPRAQQRLYELRAQSLRQLHEWLERYRELWEARFEELDELIERLKKRRSPMIEGREVRPLDEPDHDGAEGDRDIVITRTFNGPPRTCSTPGPVPSREPLVGPEVAGRLDDGLRGGRARRRSISLRAPASTGRQFAFSGSTPRSRLIRASSTRYSSPRPAAQAGRRRDHRHVTFDEHDGKTYLVSHSCVPSKDVRDAIIATGMEHGMRETMEQLEQLIASLHEGRTIMKTTNVARNIDAYIAGFPRPFRGCSSRCEAPSEGGAGVRGGDS